MPEQKGELAASGKVKACPACGVKFTAPLDGGVRVECADEDEGGCGKSFRVVY